MTNPMPQEYYDLLEEIQAVDFVLVELTLYLDTHPQDYETIQQFNQYSQYTKQLKQQYEQLYGPLMEFGMSYSSYPWKWDNAPWPWQV
ncbi:spore coat protein CotJB [Aquibacillus sp. 3ASR75-11]|uniref:Spore coat protein CotJB n=1 Tax=Terrihalobacillus insolitus TaxID=2950438 RepID=A0A9X4ALX1_9BACI|nr:spore coat protein CotJB [Terrihalobacillus insolitus]MDC3413080.1 spore coat protein CotJB [Terrihalobacillus insolitus]MDC3424822.1 spore coat protein CotJB [Terrihalobacillus insolitus]